jgi:hypothetical protein
MGYREVLELLRAKADLRPGLTVERATDLQQVSERLRQLELQPEDVRQTG